MATSIIKRDGHWDIEDISFWKDDSFECTEQEVELYRKTDQERIVEYGYLGVYLGYVKDEAIECVVVLDREDALRLLTSRRVLDQRIALAWLGANRTTDEG